MNDQTPPSDVPDAAMRFEVKVAAVGEVRDAAGNLLSTSDVTFETLNLSADEVRALTGQEPPTAPTTTVFTSDQESSP